jgi:predicted  nucleic acid-binding Zn-ribbon protein
MDVRCHHCGHIFPTPEESFGTREKMEVPCPACGKPLQIVNPKLATLSVDRTRKKVPQIVSQISPEGRLLLIPQNMEISLKVLDGEEKGTVYPITKPRCLIGRTNADVAVNDSQVSRVHCALEVSAEGVELRDLASTNGTFVDEKAIETAALSNGSTFRIGSHVFQLIITTTLT